jgi:enamine deaminase RidA (YjgF/YER057c/UK114 family)
MKKLNPPDVAAPLSRYSHAMAVPENYRWLHVSGQVGMRPDGTMARGAEAQLEQTWRNLLAILRADGMGPADLVKVTTLLTPGVEVGLSRRIRERSLEGAEPASTLIVVAGLANPDILVEIEVVAARPA